MLEQTALDTSMLLLALAAVGAVVLGGLVLGLVLILGRRTRVAGIVILALLALGVSAVLVAFVAFNPVMVPVKSQRLAPEPAGSRPLGGADARGSLLRTANLRLWT